MPSVLISTCKGRSAVQKRLLMQSIADALIETLNVRPEACNVRIVEFSKDDFIIPGTEEHDQLIIEIFCFVGRSQEQKELFYQQAAQNLINIDEDPSCFCSMIFHDIPKHNWGLMNGQSAANVFK